MSRVSVITPAYNAASFLGQTIESVQNQTYSDWEMIIVDDCSTDGTFDIAQKTAQSDARIKVLKNRENSGVAVSRNNAIDAASGEYIAFLDSDDLWLPRKLEEQVAFMDAGGYALTYTDYQKFDSKTGNKGKVVRAPSCMTAKRIYGDTSIGCLTVMVNRRLVGNFHMPKIEHTEDNATWQEILSRGFTAYGLGQVLALYREGTASMTSSKKNAAKKQWRTYREYYKFSVPRSIYYFCNYAYHAVKKHFM